MSNGQGVAPLTEPADIDGYLELVEAAFEEGRTADACNLIEELVEGACIAELRRLEQFAEFVSHDRIDMVGMNFILGRIKELSTGAGAATAHNSEEDKA